MATIHKSLPGARVEVPGHDKALLLEGENEVLRLIVGGTPLPVVLQELAKLAEQERAPGLRASIFLLEKDNQNLRFAAAPSFPAAFAKEAGRIPIGPKSGACGAAAFRRTPILINDITDELGPEFCNFAAAYNVNGCWSMPIISSVGGLLGTFAIYYQEPSTPADSDRAVLEMLARTCAVAIERAQAARNLADSEERLRSLSRCSPIGIFTADVGQTFMYVNPRFREIGAFSYEKTVEYWLENTVDPDHRETVLAEWARSVAGRREFSEEFPIVDDLGTVRWINLRAAPMKSSRGEHIGYVGTVEDVSERRRTESVLRSEFAFRQAIEESIPCGIMTLNLDGRRTYVNRAFAEMIGASPEELVNEVAPFKNWPPEHHEEIRARFQQMLSGNAPKEGLELTFQRRNGEPFTALIRSSELLDAGKRYGWVVSVLDITERERAEESLRQSEAWLRLALDVGQMGAWEWDIGQNTIRWSAQLERIHGLQPGKFGGTFDDFHRDMNPADRPRVFATIQEALRTGGAYHVGYEITRPDGEHVFLEARGQVFSNERGEAIKMVGVCEDVTERKIEENRLLEEVGRGPR